MKRSILFAAVILFSCKGKQADYQKATDALDAGREYINANLQGDFSKAAFYAVTDKKNQQLLAEQEKAYREKDKEGRQQLRTASININEVKELSDSITEIHYRFSFDTIPHTLTVVKRDGAWLADPGKN